MTDTEEHVTTEQQEPVVQEEKPSEAPGVIPDPDKFTPEPLPKDDPSRKMAESTATPLSYQNLILKSYLEQNFNINKHLKVTFRTLSSGMVEFIFRKLSHTHRQEWATIFDEALRIHYVAASLQKFNDNDIGPDMDEAYRKGEDEATRVLEERVEYVKALPAMLANLLYAHYVLFSDRVDNFIKDGGTEELGNS